MKSTFWVTGASKGIGLCCSLQLLQMGYQVVGISRSKPPISQKDFFWITYDLSKTEGIESFFRLQLKQFPKTCGILLNAGEGLLGNLEEYAPSKMDHLLRVNLLSPMLLTKLFLPTLKKQVRSHILAIGSEASFQGKKRGSVYCGSKFGLRGFLQAMQDELQNSSIDITMIHPGICKTEFFSSLTYQLEEGGLDPEEVANLLPWILSQKSGSFLPEIYMQSKRSKLIQKQKLSNTPVGISCL